MSTYARNAGMRTVDGEGARPEPRAAVNASVRNSLSVAASPLLRALADMPDEMAADEDVVVLRQLMLDAVHGFERDCEMLRVRREHALIGGYALCTALDEAASRTAWGKRNDWAGRSVLVHCYQDAYGGEKVFQLLGRLAASPLEHAPLIELLYRILALGFRGRYAGRGEGERELDGIRARLWRVIDSTSAEASAGAARPAAALRFSGEGRPKTAWLDGLPPAWTSAALAGLVLVALHGAIRFQLGQDSAAVHARIARVGARPADISASVAPESLFRTLRALLADDIESGRVAIAESGDRVILTVPGSDVFDAGQAEVRAPVPRLLMRIAHAITRGAAHATVIAHTDDAPIHTARFPSNQALSDARAATIVNLLVAQGVGRDNVHGVGRGEREPVAGSGARGDRARHRRVEIVLARGTEEDRQ
jgi:type VI secretion system protein ImpK